MRTSVLLLLACSLLLLGCKPLETDAASCNELDLRACVVQEGCYIGKGETIDGTLALPPDVCKAGVPTEQEKEYTESIRQEVFVGYVPTGEEFLTTDTPTGEARFGFRILNEAADTLHVSATCTLLSSEEEIPCSSTVIAEDTEQAISLPGEVQLRAQQLHAFTLVTSFENAESGTTGSVFLTLSRPASGASITKEIPFLYE